MGELAVVLLFMIVVVPVVTVAFAMVVLEDTSAMLVVGLLALVTGVVLVDLSILGVVVWVGVLVAGVIRLGRPSRGTHPPPSCNGGRAARSARHARGHSADDRQAGGLSRWK